ncbi:DUF1176 domain-containing protein [Nissabacter sp. SGAir0207]|uniref:DUF1176 domain-containing protein n=1 Tax=Nissabacter sp. SGAir0207 TaxID=2126321 RepID=UPI001F0F3214|nr:DUF1176 domain-containing protein [Nissabacter sp. SGAir0207]
MMLRVITFSVLLLAALQVAADPLQQDYSDWTVSCDNLNRCQARNINDHNGLVLLISREAGPQGRAEVRLDNQQSEVFPDSDTRPIAPRLLLDGKVLRLNPREWQIADRLTLADNPLVVADFIARIREGSALTLSGEEKIKLRQVVSLKGFKAALLAMDAQQGRVESVTAWTKPGSQPAESVPPAPQAPEAPVFALPQPLTETEIAALTQFAATNIDANDCTLEPSERDIRLTPLSADRALILVNCDMGAYNLFSLAYLANRHAPFKAEELALNAPFKLNGTQTLEPEMINADMDEAKGELTLYAKGRGIGDCGESSRWIYDGKQFVLAEYRSEPHCDGVSQHGWPLLWTTRG